MSTLKLNNVEINPSDIQSVVFDKAGARLNAKAVSASSESAADLTVPQNTLIVRLKDGTGFSSRGSEAEEVLALLQRIREEHQLNFPFIMNDSK